METQLAFLIASCGIGAFAIVTVGIVFLKKNTFKWPGAAMLLAGVLLIGLPVWRTMDIAWDKAGFHMKFETLERRLAAVDKKVEAASASTLTASQELAAIKTQMPDLQKQVAELHQQSPKVESIAAALQKNHQTLQGMQAAFQASKKLQERVEGLEVKHNEPAPDKGSNRLPASINQ